MKNAPLSLEALQERWVPAKQLATVDRLIDLKHQNQTDIWVVVDAVIALWMKQRPTEYRSFIVDTEIARQTRANAYGANKKASLRYTVDMPEWVYHVLRRLYDAEELDMSKEFFQLFWKRYPIFRVSEKV